MNNGYFIVLGPGAINNGLGKRFWKRTLKKNYTIPKLAETPSLNSFGQNILQASLFLYKTLGFGWGKTLFATREAGTLHAQLD